jgi:ribulose 1,5-bisphosphate synthetase/thiazole synthase
VQAGEAGVQVAAVEEGVDRRGGFWGEAGYFGSVVVENLPDR